MEVRDVTLDDDLDQLVADINRASWDEANEISGYDVGSLRAYLKRQDTLFTACYDLTNGKRKLLGIASSRIEIKPYGEERWLYVDEIDVCVDQRRKGVAKLIMQKLLQIANDSGCEELWLGTEIDNQAANALYKSLNPDDIANVIGYTYETDE